MWAAIAKRPSSSSAITDEHVVLFLAEDLVPGEPQFDDTERIEIRRLPLTEAFEMANDGRIIDAISFAALLFLRQKPELWKKA